MTLRSSGVLTGLGLALLAGCTDASWQPPLQSDKSAIVLGQLSTSSDDAVVFVQGQGNGCTGTLIAPHVVLTALHCVTNFDSRYTFNCESDGTLEPGSTNGDLGPTIDPSLVSVAVGVELDKTRTAVSQIFSTNSPEVCRDDLAVLVLESAPDIGSAPLVSVRFDRPTTKGELTRAIGYGDTEDTSTENGRQEHDDIAILGVGGPNISTPGDTGVAPRTLQIGVGPCHGDSGGPIFSEETGAEVGLYSLLDASTCQGPGVTNTYTQVAPFEALIRMALDAAGEEPIVEPPEPESAGGAAGATGTGDAGETGTAGTPAEVGGGSALGGSGGSTVAVSGGSSGSGGSGGGTSGTGGNSNNGDDDSMSEAGGESIGSGSRQDPSCTCRTGGATRGGPLSTLLMFAAGLLGVARRRLRY